MALGDAGLLKFKDAEKSTAEVFDILCHMKTKADEITDASGITNAAAKAVVKYARALWLYGLVHNKEANVTLDADTGKKAFKNVIGSEDHVDSASENFSDWLQYLSNAKNKLAIMHNHTKSLPISLDDIWFFLKRSMVIHLLITDKDGNVTLIEKKAGMAYDADAIINGLKDKIKIAHDKARNLEFWKSLSGDKLREYKILMYEAVVRVYLEEVGVHYVKFNG
jgi:hypothetical protein